MASISSLVRILTRNQAKFEEANFPPILGAGSRKVLVSEAPILANFFKEMKMSKLRVRGTLVTLVLLAAVAVFPHVVQAPRAKQPNCEAATCGARNTGVLMADGTDPWPPPPRPIPWSNQSA
jgi:hypothetical protein